MANGLPPLYISSNGAVLPGRNDAKMGPANSLHASALCSEYNERFTLIHKEVVGDFIRFLQIYLCLLCVEFFSSIFFGKRP